MVMRLGFFGVSTFFSTSLGVVLGAGLARFFLVLNSS
jgi:hypothetical protein